MKHVITAVRAIFADRGAEKIEKAFIGQGSIP